MILMECLVSGSDSDELYQLFFSLPCLSICLSVCLSIFTCLSVGVSARLCELRIM